jgi:hypothetical protein
MTGPACAYDTKIAFTAGRREGDAVPDRDLLIRVERFQDRVRHVGRARELGPSKHSSVEPGLREICIAEVRQVERPEKRS